jgi:hypothetical protein
MISIQGLSHYFNKDFIVAAGHLKNVLTVNPRDVTASDISGMQPN